MQTYLFGEKKTRDVGRTTRMMGLILYLAAVLDSVWEAIFTRRRRRSSHFLLKFLPVSRTANCRPSIAG